MLEEECGGPCCSISGVLNRKELQEKRSALCLCLCMWKSFPSSIIRLCTRRFFLSFLGDWMYCDLFWVVVLLYGSFGLVGSIGLSRNLIQGCSPNLGFSVLDIPM